jgi:hypothetical protein
LHSTKNKNLFLLENLFLLKNLFLLENIFLLSIQCCQITALIIGGILSGPLASIS